jgi:hypothetical protein
MQRFESRRPSQPVRLQRVTYECRSKTAPYREVAEKSFDLEPRQLQSAIEIGSFEITEVFDQSAFKKPSLVVRFSTLGLSANIVALQSKCASKSKSKSVIELLD